MTDSEYRALAEVSPMKAQRKLFDEYYRYVYAVVFGRLRNTASREDIEECVSDAFSAIYQYCGSSSGHEGELRGIIGTIADRAAIKTYRRLSRRPPDSSLDDGSADRIAAPDDIESETERAVIQQRLLDCIAELGEPDASIILLRYYYGRSSGETAAELGLTPAAVRKRCSRAAEKLRKKLSDEGITI